MSGQGSLREIRMEHGQSRDGTEIAFARSGSGPPLVLVHGALSDHTAWNAIVPLLAPDFTVYAIDRRGRGGSGDTAPYAVEREVEDIAAVLERIGEPAHLLARSSGGVLALHVARHGPLLRRLALYEPAVIIDGQRPRPSADLADRLDALVRAGDREAAVRTFMREGPGRSDAEIDRMAATPQWAARAALAHTAAYDARVGEYVLDPVSLGAIDTPTLVMLGGASPGWMRAGVEAVAAALSDSRMVVIPGQEHFAIYTAPDLVARAVARFLDASD